MDTVSVDRTCEPIPFKSAEGSTPIVVTSFRKYLTIDEETQIRQQFHNIWRWNNQVMWSGTLREYAQAWADQHGMATLTTAMGPLMTPEHPLCLKRQKSKVGWSKYIKGASALFAWHISRGERVIVLTPPPPERFHSSGHTSYQAIEEPILKGEKEGGTRLRLEMVHPMVERAENFIYQLWPVDQTNCWVERFGALTQRARCWRLVKGFPEQARIRETPKCAMEDGVVTHAQESEFEEKYGSVERAGSLEGKESPEKEGEYKRAGGLEEKERPKKEGGLRRAGGIEGKESPEKDGGFKGAGGVEGKESPKKEGGLGAEEGTEAEGDVERKFVIFCTQAQYIRRRLLYRKCIDATWKTGVSAIIQKGNGLIPS